MRKSGADHLVGRVIANKFAIESLLGQGAMGAVYRARQMALEKTVAIKVLHGEHADDATFAARFHREAKAASRLNHPNSMQVIDFGQEPDGLLYIAMEYLDGRNLHRIFKDEFPLAPERVADILMQTLAALAVAHDMGVVHRDLKPENVMVLSGTDDDGRPTDLVKVCDFGIAKMTDSRHYKKDGDAADGAGDRESQGPVTTAGFLVGTPEYMSPEQGKGEKLDARSDLYSVGVILYQGLTGVCPFEAENAIGVVLKHITEEAARPTAIRPAAHRRLEAVCIRAMKKSREERYQSAREMRADLRAAVEGGHLTPPALSSGHELPSIKIHAPGMSPDSAQAATEAALAAPSLDERMVEAQGPAKMTLTGTEAEVPGVPNRRRRFAVLVSGLVALIAGFALVAALTANKEKRDPSDAKIAQSESSSARGSSSQKTVPLTTPQSGSTQANGARPDSHAAQSSKGKISPSPSAFVNVHPATSGGALPAASESSPSAVPTASSPPLPVPTVTASATPTPSSSPPAPEPFDADRAYAVVGFIDAQGARDTAVKASLRQVNLTGCYRASLKSSGIRTTGFATLTISFDETGHARSAIFRGSGFAREMQSCIQSSASGIQIPKSQVDPGGGTASANLEFRSP